jgi:hypothetical protein
MASVPISVQSGSMPTLSSTLCSSRTTLAAIAIVCAVPSIARAQSGPSQRPIYLPDPTPRPPDLQRQYSNDPVARAKQQQAALLRAAQRRQQVVLDTNDLLQLAQELKDDLAKHNDSPTMIPNATKPEEIEKLAKTIKQNVRAR